ncbi:spermatogenesis-associated protein 2 [Mustelus asterias]
MDTNKIRDTLFRKYVQICELKLSEKDHLVDDASLKKTATSLLDLYRQESSERFKMFRFYDMVENALRMLRTSSLSALLTAFGILETFCTNLFLYPWKKEFKTIKTFTGHFVYYIKSALCEDDIWNILYHIGYQHEKEAFELKNKVNANRVKLMSFELFLAGIECENLLEICSQIKGKGYSELNVIEERKNSTEDVRGCIDVMKRQRRLEDLHASVTRMDFRRSDSERLTNNYMKHFIYKPSSHVDNDENQVAKQLNKVSLTPVHHKKETAYGASFEDMTDEIYRPTPSLLTMSSSPRLGSDEYLHSPNDNWRAENNFNMSFQALDDDLDLYTAEDPKSTLTPRWTDSTSHSTRLIKNNDLRGVYHETSHLTKESVSNTIALKCQMCGMSSGTITCQKCDKALCNQCHRDTGECSLVSSRHEYPRVVGILSRSSSVQNDLSVSSAPKEKCAFSITSQYQERLPSFKSTSTLRCGFCDKPGAKFTCMNCSKVSCDDCRAVYHQDLCNKNKMHSFYPNSQLNYKSGKMYSLYR